MIKEKQPWDKTPDEFKKMREDADKAASDWSAECSVCHVHLTGTLAQLKAHVCEVKK